MLSKSQVQHVANLAKLKISEVEAEQYSHELTKVLAYIDELQAVDIADTEVGLAAAGSLDSLRADQVHEWPAEARAVALAQAARDEAGLVKVPKII